jgi:predicted RecA/RadA family phage recombinase
MALTANVKLRERMAPGEFAYVPLAGETIYEGSLCALNAAGTVQRIQTSGSAVFAGIAGGQRINTPSGNDARPVRMRKGIWALTVPSATAANIGATVYATDDSTVTLTAGSNLAIGTLAGIENGQTFVKLNG